MHALQVSGAVAWQYGEMEEACSTVYQLGIVFDYVKTRILFTCGTHLEKLAEGGICLTSEPPDQ